MKNLKDLYNYCTKKMNLITGLIVVFQFICLIIQVIYNIGAMCISVFLFTIISFLLFDFRTKMEDWLEDVIYKNKLLTSDYESVNNK